jgi:hypothetical protein
MEPDLAEWSTLVGNCLEGQTITQTTFIPAKIAEVATHYPIALIQMIAGWFVSGFAISMGAPFWFDLLGKIMNVRNSGNKPKTPAT